MSGDYNYSAIRYTLLPNGILVTQKVKPEAGRCPDCGEQYTDGGMTGISSVTHGQLICCGFCSTAFWQKDGGVK